VITNGLCLIASVLPYGNGSLHERARCSVNFNFIYDLVDSVGISIVTIRPVPEVDRA
jgi:hypothetical protein